MNGCQRTVYATLAFLPSLSLGRRPLQIVHKNPVAYPGGVTRVSHLEGHELSVVAHDRTGRFVTRIITEMSQALDIVAAAVQLQLPEVNVVWALQVLLVAFNQREFAVRINAFRLVILSRRVRVVELRKLIRSSFFGLSVASGPASRLVPGPSYTSGSAPRPATTAEPAPSRCIRTLARTSQQSSSPDRKNTA
jgi:hypothetical protein